MKFRNVKVPEGINVSRHNPFADLFILTAGVLAFLAVLALGLYFLGGSLARYMPVAWENALANAILDERPAYDDEAAAAESLPANALIMRVCPSMERSKRSWLWDTSSRLSPSMSFSRSTTLSRTPLLVNLARAIWNV